ncbi:MAG: AAA family ATPase [Desulfobacteraceae bacterium]|jgi:general secretion pathway protein A
MYTSHFGFNAKPFQISSDPRFLWLGEQHKEALAILEYGIQENQGVIALSGDVGTGKTTLVNALTYRIKHNVIAAVVSDPGLEPMDFFCYIANLYDLTNKGLTNRLDTKVEFLFHFRAFLKNASQQKKKVLLVIDEAQRINANLLEEIRMLSNIEQSGVRLLNLFLVGQNELNAMLLKPENRSFKQRIATHFNLVPLTLDEIDAYIGYRLGVVGCGRRIFTGGAVGEIFKFSKGYPRLINAICDQSLISAYVKDSRKVTADMVAGSAKDFLFPHQALPNPPVPDSVINTGTVEASIPPPVRPNHQKGKMHNRSKNQNEKNGFPFIRLAYIGLGLVLLIFSWYYLYQYGEDAKPQSTTAHSPTHAEKSVTLNAVTDTPPVAGASSRRSSVFSGRVLIPTESPRQPRPAEKEGELNVQSATPSEPETKPGVMFSGKGGGSDLPATDASPPALSNDKDPGAIIDWLIQKKNN